MVALAVRIGDPAQPGAVAAIEEDHGNARLQAQHRDQIAGLLVPQGEARTGTQVGLDEEAWKDL